jgi:Tol biopolymer transport system component
MTPNEPREDQAPRRDERLGSWKAIAAYMKRDVTTVQRWERREGMPVHRHQHDRRGSVYAYKGELDAWLAQRSTAPDALVDAAGEPRAQYTRPRFVVASLLAAVLLFGMGYWWIGPRTTTAPPPLAGARFSPLTDFPGLEQAAAISRDGRYVAFLSARSGRVDVWVGETGGGEFRNLTTGATPELLNPEIRNLAFTPDGANVLAWTRVPGGAVATWSVPVAGGTPSRWRDDVVEVDWSRDGRRLVFHTPAPGDPTFVVEADGSTRQVYVGGPGIHNHFQVWAPDDRAIYFVRGTPPDDTDLWRIAPDGTGLERLTTHRTRVAYPTFVDPDTLLYLATTPDDAGPWLYALDLRTRVSRRISFGVERYTSLAASAGRRRLVATVGHARSSLWRVPLENAAGAAPSRIDVPTVGGGSPRAGDGFLLYVSAKNDGHALQKLADGSVTELWSAPGARIVGGPALAPDGRRIAFTAEDARGTRLYVGDAHLAGARSVSESLVVRGAPAWSPDGRSIVVAMLRGDVPRLVRVPLDGGPPTPLIDTYSLNPAWSPDGTFLVYASADDGPDFTLDAIAADGTPRVLPPIRLPRAARRVAFTPDGRELIVLLGEMRTPDLWAIDLATGDRRLLADFDREFTVREFDVSRDGREIVFDRREDEADVVLIETARGTEN